MPKFRTQYDPYEKRVRPGLECKDPSLTDQSAAPEADINVMLERFHVTGQPPKIAPVMPTYADYTGITDFADVRSVMLRAEDAFMSLPADLRAKLGHDPQQFLLYVQDPDNASDLIKRGFMKPPAGGIGGVAPDAKPAGSDPAPAATNTPPASP